MGITCYERHDRKEKKLKSREIIEVTLNENKKKKLERERIERERIAKERIEKERIEKERIEKERIEKERIVKKNKSKDENCIVPDEINIKINDKISPYKIDINDKEKLLNLREKVLKKHNEFRKKHGVGNLKLILHFFIQLKMI